MKRKLRITRLSLGDDDGLLHYKLAVSSNEAAAALDFYGYSDQFQLFGEQLKNFPVSSKSVIKLQIGQDSPEWAYYMLLEVFCYQSNGESVILVQVKNKLDAPESIDCRFYILALPAELNRLGQHLISWNPLETASLTWQFSD